MSDADVYGPGGAEAGITFADFASDAEAMEEAARLLRYHDLDCVEVCDLRREVGSLRRYRPSEEQDPVFTWDAVWESN